MVMVMVMVMVRVMVMVSTVSQSPSGQHQIPRDKGGAIDFRLPLPWSAVFE